MDVRRINLIFLFLLLLIGLFVLDQWSSNFAIKQGKEDFRNFNSAEINGVIVRLEIKHHSTGMKINNSETEFIFNAYSSLALNGGSNFDFIAKNGDSVVKHAFSDTLLLKKEDKVYKYKFQKIE